MEPIFSTRFYEDELVKSYDCYIIDDDKLRIVISSDSVKVGQINLTEKTLLELLDTDVEGEYFNINHTKIKKSFIKNLKVLLVEEDDGTKKG